jgi:hypothetical protein
MISKIGVGFGLKELLVDFCLICRIVAANLYLISITDPIANERAYFWYAML